MHKRHGIVSSSFVLLMMMMTSTDLSWIILKAVGDWSWPLHESVDGFVRRMDLSLVIRLLMSARHDVRVGRRISSSSFQPSRIAAETSLQRAGTNLFRDGAAAGEQVVPVGAERWYLMRRGVVVLQVCGVGIIST